MENNITNIDIMIFKWVCVCVCVRVCVCVCACMRACVRVVRHVKQLTKCILWLYHIIHSKITVFIRKYMVLHLSVMYMRV